MPRDVEHFDGAPPLAGAVAPIVRDGARRYFLFVLGPFGPFTRQLGASLRRAGALCDRVVLNGGDLYDWGPSHAHIYQGGLAGWSRWLEALVRRRGVTDLILYGDSHPYCAEAARVGARLSLGTHVLEQGYFRPFWITLERNGVNGASTLPRCVDDYLRAAPLAPEPTEEWLPPLTPPAVRKLAAYHTALWLTTPVFPAFRLPYDYSLPRQALGHTRRYLHQRLFRGRLRRALKQVLEAPGPLFLVILQRPGDSQLRRHSPFPTVADFIDRVMTSFARHAPADARLLFKAHPLDHGLEPHRRNVETAASAAGVRARVSFADIGDLRAMTTFAAGAVTVNSTAGLTALEVGLPTIALGAAIYDLPGLTHQGGLDRFWSAPEAPDRTLFTAYRKVVMAQTQISGAYARARGIELAVPEAARRLLAD